MNEVNKEILLITQEECAEVTQAISKVFRFGASATHNGKTNQEHLAEEVDFLRHEKAGGGGQEVRHRLEVE